MTIIADFSTMQSMSLTPEQRDVSYRLLEGVFPKDPQAQHDFHTIPEENPYGFSLLDPLPEIFQGDVFSYAKVICRDDNDREMLKNHLNAYDRAETADLLVKTIRLYGSSPNEEAIEVIAQGVGLFEQVTGFHTEIISEGELESLLPGGMLPRKIDFLSRLLEIRHDFLQVYNKGLSFLQYSPKDEGKSRILAFGLRLVPEEQKDTQTIGQVGVTTLFGMHDEGAFGKFTQRQTIQAFRALSGYDLNAEIITTDPQF